jgi:hypothetical protein
MYEKPSNESASHGLVNPLKTLTRAQFAALGGEAVAYVRPVRGAVLAAMISDTPFDHDGDYQLVMSADGTPLLVTDSEDAVVEWLGDKSIGLATLH